MPGRIVVTGMGDNARKMWVCNGNEVLRYFVMAEIKDCSATVANCRSRAKERTIPVIDAPGRTIGDAIKNRGKTDSEIGVSPHSSCMAPRRRM